MQEKSKREFMIMRKLFLYSCILFIFLGVIGCVSFNRFSILPDDKIGIYVRPVLPFIKARSTGSDIVSMIDGSKKRVRKWMYPAGSMNIGEMFINRSSSLLKNAQLQLIKDSQVVGKSSKRADLAATAKKLGFNKIIQIKVQKVVSHKYSWIPILSVEAIMVNREGKVLWKTAVRKSGESIQIAINKTQFDKSFKVLPSRVVDILIADFKRGITKVTCEEECKELFNQNKLKKGLNIETCIQTMC